MDKQAHLFPFALIVFMVPLNASCRKFFVFCKYAYDPILNQIYSGIRHATHVWQRTEMKESLIVMFPNDSESHAAPYLMIP